MAELTFVCLEPGWEAMDLCLYSDAMEIGSRIVVAEIPIGEPFPLENIARWLRGNTALARDPVIARTISAATCFLRDRELRCSTVLDIRRGRFLSSGRQKAPTQTATLKAVFDLPSIQSLQYLVCAGSFSCFPRRRSVMFSCSCRFLDVNTLRRKRLVDPFAERLW